MSWLRHVRLLFRFLARRRTQEEELDAEVRDYFETLVERKVERGLPVEEARRLTRLQFEGPEQVKKKVRDARPGAWMAALARDIQYAFRGIRKDPAFAAVTILTLALGIGATTAMFSVAYSVLLRPLPYRDAGRLVQLFATSANDAREPLLLPNFEMLKAQSRSFSGMAVYYKDSGFSNVTLTGGSEPQSVQGGYVSADFFRLLGRAPLAGRVFSTDEVRRGERVVVLSQKLWNERFGSAADLSGRKLEIDGGAFQVVGVMPGDFQFPARDIQFWAPITTNRYWLDKPAADSNKVRGYYARWNALARLRRETSIQEARSELSLLAGRLEKGGSRLDRGLALTAVPLEVEVSGNTRLALSILLVAVCFLLLIACVNAAHLMLARGARREQEIAVRLSLGARQGDLLRQWLIESLVLSLGAGFCGVALAAGAVRALTAAAPIDVPRLEQARLDWAMLAFALGVSFLAAIVSGLLPAWKFSRAALNEGLRAGGRGSSDTAGVSRIRAGLVVAEFALTVVLLTGSGLLIRSFLAVQAVDPGFNPEHLLTVRVALPAERSPGVFYEQMLERIYAIPGVRAVGAINGLFEPGLVDGKKAEPGQQRKPDRLRVRATWKSIRADYFQAMGIALLRGRFFGSQDRAHAPLVAIVDESMARRYWPGENALGKQFRGYDKRGLDDDPLTVIGVVRETRSGGREARPTPHVFQPVTQLEKRDNPATPDLIIRTAGDPAKLEGTVRSMVRSLDRTAIVSGVATMEQQMEEQLSPRRFQTWLLSTFSLLALALASIGVYGVMHYAVVQRTHEMGIRMALGAEPSQLLKLVLQEALLMVMPGLMIGLFGARLLTTLLGSILFGVKPTDPVTYLMVAIALTSVALGAVFAPAWRAARIDPVEALRQE